MAAAAAVLLVLMGAIAMPAAEAQVLVVMGAYNTTCPQAEEMVLNEMTAIVAKSPDLAAAVLRLFSVDCFVDGCEGFILLDSTPGNTAEKDAPLNRGVRGYEVVDAIKAKLDAACPGVVSCADTLALAARDSIRLARCSTVSPRLYDFAGHNGASDPALDGNYTATLQARGQRHARRPGPHNPGHLRRRLLRQRRLLSTDAALLGYSDYVERQAKAASPDAFFADFAEAFVAMSRLDVLTHRKGEIRKVCSKVNPPSDSPPVVVPSPPSSSAAAAAMSYQLIAGTGGLLLALAMAVALVL